MATYYVRKTGNDSNAGTSAGAAWLTVDKAANTVAAGDTVYIGAGTYRELVTMDTSGSSGSVISYTGDITGTYTGDAGLVIITAHDSDDAVSTRASVVDFNGKSFFEWHNCMFIGGTAFVVGNTAYASATAYEGVVISNCVVIATSNTFGVKAELNAGATPTTSGLKILQSTVHGGIDFDWDSNGTADINLKILIDSCRVIAIGGNDGIQCSRVTNGGAFYIGGVTISNCYVSGNTTEAIYFSYLLSTTYPCIVANNIIAYPTTYGVSNLSGTAGAVLLYGNVVLGATNISNVCTEVIGNSLRAVALLGGLHDQHLYQAFGYSPYLPFEPMTAGGYTSPVIDLGHNDYAQTLDHYGNPRNMGRATPAGKLYYMDGSDAAATDPNAVWTNEANVVDSSEVTYASVATTGSTASNYVMAEGTSAPASGGTIAKVQARLIHGATSGSPSGEVVVYSDGLAETLATVSVSSTTTVTASPWADLTPPTGGWTWAGIQALEFKAYRTARVHGDCIRFRSASSPIALPWISAQWKHATSRHRTRRFTTTAQAVQSSPALASWNFR